MADRSPEVDQAWEEFHSVINMTGDELRTWLLTNASGEEALPQEYMNVTMRGEQIVAVLNKRKSDVTDSDLELMDDVAQYVRTQLAQPRREDPDWRRGLMSVGHDPLSPDSARPDEEDLA